MENITEKFYDELASDYHLIFSNWKQSVLRQGGILTDFILPRFEGKLPEAQNQSYEQKKRLLPLELIFILRLVIFVH